MKAKIHIALCALTLGSVLTGCGISAKKESVVTEQTLSENWQVLLDSELSQWERWLGVPHTSVQDLPVGTFQSSELNLHGDPSQAIGLNNDPKQVFSVIEENGKPVLAITGEIYGGLTSKHSYSNYHLSLQIKWGDKKWEPRLNALRDSGILFHCRGEHGAFWRVWKLCHEFQIQETDLGDYIPLGNESGKLQGDIRARPPRAGEHPKRPVYDPEGTRQTVAYASASPEVDRAHGEWNTLELLAFANKAVFVVNGEVVMAVQNIRDVNNNALSSGQLQIQSEGAELYIRDAKIKSLPAIPAAYSGLFD